MREIKFRAWHITSGMATFTMNDLYNFEAEGARKSYVCFPDGDIHKLDDVEVMQFTGLHDKNGKEIYEGDIVEFTAYTAFREQSENRTEVVTYSCEPNGRVGFTPMVWHTDVEDDYYNYEIENIRIIGNIYENPELLEDK